MDKPHTSLLAPAISACVLSIAYVAGYFALSESGECLLGFRLRKYDYKWLPAIYYPASQIESCVIRRRVVLDYPKSDVSAID